MEHHHGVEAPVDRVLVAELLVAPVAAVDAVAEDDELVAVGREVERGPGGVVLAAVIHDVHDLDRAPHILRNAPERVREKLLGIVGEDKDAKALSPCVERVSM